ncbi:hypothetical protein D4764_09G0009570 [Takifugu flavidus]|uniref:Uncharacterized protein n=1 Tax=Takifugu flavidus TaxID=433684 RepID=A0A5C6MRB3_9TELE|nr:hypothetical protein D4764_09G0009570 [Takifugu flavidus]
MRRGKERKGEERRGEETMTQWGDRGLSECPPHARRAWIGGLLRRDWESKLRFDANVRTVTSTFCISAEKTFKVSSEGVLDRVPLSWHSPMLGDQAEKAPREVLQELYLSMKPEETEKLVKLQTCLNDIKSWMSSNFLLLNSGKTEVMVFGPESLRDRLDRMINLDGISLTFSLSVKNLGVTFDQNISFNSHIKTVSRSAFFHLRNITRIRKLLTRHDAEKLVHAFVTSRLDYCNSLLSGCPNNSSRSLQLIQNAAARVLTGIDKRDHITPVMASLHWLPVKFRIIFKTLLLSYKVLRGLAPSYLEELVIPYQPNRPLRSQKAGLLVVPRVSRSRMGGRAFSYQAPLLWNQLPVQVREADSIATFKIRLKTYLFEKAYCY